MRYRRDLRRAEAHARTSRFILVPFLAGSLLGGGYTMGSFPNLAQSARKTERITSLEQERDDWRVKGQATEEALALHAQLNANIAKRLEEYAQDKDTLQRRLTKAEDTLAHEKKERMELDVLVGQAEQRLAGLEDPHDHPRLTSETFLAILPIKERSSTSEDTTDSDSTLDVSSEQSFEETNVQPDGELHLPMNATSLYTGRLQGQISFEGRQRDPTPDWNRRRIYVLVRWGESSWIVTEGRARVDSAGAVEGAFKVILPISTIRTLDVTAIATDKEYRRYQHVRLPDHKWKGSTATIAVDRS